MGKDKKDKKAKKLKDKHKDKAKAKGKDKSKAKDKVKEVQGQRADTACSRRSRRKDERR